MAVAFDAVKKFLIKYYLHNTEINEGIKRVKTKIFIDPVLICKTTAARNKKCNAQNEQTNGKKSCALKTEERKKIRKKARSQHGQELNETK